MYSLDGFEGAKPSGEGGGAGANHKRTPVTPRRNNDGCVSPAAVRQRINAIAKKTSRCRFFLFFKEVFSPCGAPETFLAFCRIFLDITFLFSNGGQFLVV